jgi:hypothetical protein
VHEGPEGSYKKYGHPAETIGLAAVAALGLEAVLPATGVPGWVLPAAEIIASSGAAVVTWSFTGRKLFPAYMAALGGFLGGWTIWAQAAGLWHGSTIGAWLAGMCVLVPWGISAWHKRHARPAPQLTLSAVPEPLMIEPEPDENEVQMAKFAMLFADFGITAGKDPFTEEDVPVQVTSLSEERWGRLLSITLPLSGKLTIEDFRARARNFEVALQTQEGAVTFENGSHAREVVMKVRERDGLGFTGRLTPDLRAKTVNEPFVTGVQEDGSYLRMTVRESHWMIVGIMGSGKSNLLNVLIAQLASCNDSLIWMIDMKGGRAGKPWFQAWSEGRAEAPAIDWLATTREEAQLMMEALVTASQARSDSGIGGDKIIPSAGRPQVVFVCDEMADLFGDATAPTNSELGDEAKSNNWFTKKGTLVTQKGRSEAVGSIWATQRGTNGMSGTGDMKANMDVSVALRPKKYADLQYVIPDAPVLAGRQLQYLAKTPGVGMVARGADVSQVTKFLRHGHVDGECGQDEMNPRCVPQCDIYQTSLDVGPVRPRLDQMTATALGAVYAQRWVRAQEKGIIKVPERALSGGSPSYGYGDTAEFDEMVKGLSDPERDVHPGHIRVRELLAGRGVQGASAKMLLNILEQEGIAPVRETLHRWLREDRDVDLIHHPTYRRWVAGPGPNDGGEE